MLTLEITVGAKIHILHILVMIFEKHIIQILQLKVSEKYGIFFLKFSGFSLTFARMWGQDWASQHVWPFLLGGGSRSVEACGRRGSGWQRGTSQLILQHGPLPSSGVPTVTVLIVQPCAMWCVFFH